MTKLHYRESTLETLGLIARLDQKMGPTELICSWFDDLYFPGQKRMPEYPLDTWERGQREWRECFTEGELAVLASFHAVFESLVKDLPENATYQKDRSWLRVAEAAQQALSQLSGGAQQAVPADGPASRARG